MAVETVRVYTVDENSDPLEGVLVRFFDVTDIFVTQNMSALVGLEAYAEVSLDGDDPVPIACWEMTARRPKRSRSIHLRDLFRRPRTDSLFRDRPLLVLLLLTLGCAAVLASSMIYRVVLWLISTSTF